MKLASFRSSSGVRTGAVVGDEIVDLAAVDAQVSGPMEQVIGAGAAMLDRVRRAVESGAGRRPLSEVTLAPPVQPRKFFAIGLNYLDHVEESGLAMPENLIVFTKAVSCVNGPFDPVERPIVSDKLDYEGELGFVIGRRCRHVSAAKAADVIAGYLVVNDVSVRDWQMLTPQWNLGKSFDTHGPIGPWLTTSDEIDDPHALGIRTWVNGEIRQDSNTEHLIFNCYRQVEILSTVCTLEPGDIVSTGTSSGVAVAREGQPWLVPGDRVRIEIDGLGAIENEIVQEPASASDAEPARSPAPV